MIWCKIQYIDTTTIKISPLTTFDFKYAMSVFSYKSWSPNSKKKDITIEDRYDQDFIVTSNDLIDGTTSLQSNSIYILYALFNDRKLSGFGLASNAHLPPVTDLFYQRINFFLITSSTSTDFGHFSDVYLVNNEIYRGGWYYLAANNWYLNNWADYGGSIFTPGALRRKGYIVECSGLLRDTTTVTLPESIFTLHPLFRPSQTILTAPYTSTGYTNRFDIDITIDVGILRGGVGGTPIYLSIDGISYPVGQPASI